MPRYKERCCLNLLKWQIFALQIIIFWQITVISYFGCYIARELVKLITASSSPMYRSWPQTILQILVSVSVFSHCRWEDITVFYTLSHLLSVPPSAFSSYHFHAPSVSSLPSSSSSLSFISLRVSACVRFLSVYVAILATSLANLLSSFSSLPRFIVRALQGVPRTGNGEDFLQFNIIADLATRPLW